jgi:hypothetical protein
MLGASDLLASRMFRLVEAIFHVRSPGGRLTRFLCWKEAEMIARFVDQPVRADAADPCRAQDL